MIHSNLAARKVYLGENGICKISDFRRADQIKENIVHLRKSLVGVWTSYDLILHDTTFGNLGAGVFTKNISCQKCIFEKRSNW